MCARYELGIGPRDIIERFGLTVQPGPSLDSFPGGEIRPTNRVPIIVTDAALVLSGWGLAVPWQKQPVINARVETVQEKPTFRPLVNQRALVPATAYFEWRKDGGTKFKTRITVKDDDAFAMAGFVDEDRFVILTCSPSPSIAHIHNRMPVILPRALEKDWTNPDVMFEDLTAGLGPYTGALDFAETGPKPPEQADLFSERPR